MVQSSKKRLRARASKNRLSNNQQKSVSGMTTSGSILVAGKKAPNFSLNSTADQKVSLSDFRGQPVILAFYPADWNPVYTYQLSLYAESMPEFNKHNAELLGISVDSIWTHFAFSKARK